jgi:hypothetical protein
LPERFRSANVALENAINERGERLIWLDRAMADRLRAMRGPGESYSDRQSPLMPSPGGPLVGLGQRDWSAF